MGRIQGIEDVTYIIPEDARLIKLMIENCKHIRIRVLAPIITSSIEFVRCEDVDVELAVPIGTIQVDECTAALRVHFVEYDHIGRIYHTNSPGLSLGWGSIDNKSCE